MCVCILEMWSEAIKMLKGEYAVRAIKEHKMDQAIVFCRTKIDCDNMEQYFIQQGGGRRQYYEELWKNDDNECFCFLKQQIQNPPSVLVSFL